MKNTGVNEKALNDFIGTMAVLEEKLDALKAHVENHMDTSPEEINWGTSGARSTSCSSSRKRASSRGLNPQSKPKRPAWASAGNDLPALMMAGRPPGSRARRNRKC